MFTTGRVVNRNGYDRYVYKECHQRRVGVRAKDALKTVFRKKERSPLRPLSTVWSEQADDRRNVPLPEYPRPGMARKEWTCLNGVWEYAVTDRSSFWFGPDGTIIVPFSPEAARSTVSRLLHPGEALWYRRTFPILKMKPDQRLLLHFGAVDERCTVWCNGKRLGRPAGGYLPFSFDITSAVREGGNEIILRVLDDTDQSEACRGKQKLRPGGMFYTPQSGIWQTVWMEWVPDHYIRKLTVVPSLDTSGEGGEIEIRIFARGAADGVIEIGETGERALCCSFSESDFDEEGCLIRRIRIEHARCWSPETPFLYTLHIRLGEDEVQSYFAMRTFGTGVDAAGHPCLTLNGRPYFFNGVLDQGYWPETLMTAPSDEAMVYDISQMKKLGFNMLRKHVKIEPLRWYSHCDRLGMIVWQDMVNGGGAINAPLCTYIPTVITPVQRLISDRHHRLLSRTDGKERTRYREQLLAMVDHLCSSPCVGMWVIFNEGWGQFDSAELTAAVKQADPTRPVDHASGWFDQGTGDVHSFHNYFRKLQVEKDHFHRAAVLSEYGGIACLIPEHVSAAGTYGYAMEEPEDFGRHFFALTEQVRNLQKEGLYGAVYTQVSDIEEEVNGLLTYDRKVLKTGDILSSGF